MDFGKVNEDDLSAVDFSLPPDAPGTTKLLASLKQTKKAPNIIIGCAKWGRKDWIGKIYPEKTKEKDFLEHYARQFNCIELNATFYKIPTVEQVKNWKSKVGEGFKFCPKFTQSITHIKRLKDAMEYTDRFLDSVSAFEENLGPLFLQTPPNYAPKNLDILESYVADLPKNIQVFVELRHPGWFSDPETFETVFNVLEKHKVGAVITDASGRRDCVHMRLTTPSAFIRFVGNGLHPTDYTRCDDWVDRMGKWSADGVEDMYFFMHQHEEIYSPELCKYVIEKTNAELNIKLKVPEFV